MHSVEHQFLELFRKIEDFISHFDPKSYPPPFIAQKFNQVRRKAFYDCQLLLNNKLIVDEEEKLLFFIKKFELEYVETIKSKIRPQYINFILKQGYDVPEELKAEELKKVGGMSEFIKFAIAVADRILEIETLAYTLEGLEVYGILDSGDAILNDYFDTLKDQYKCKPKNETSLVISAVETCSQFSLTKLTPIITAKALSHVKMNRNLMLQIGLLLLNGGRIPWRLVIGYLNVPWLAGGLACSYLLQWLNSYMAKRKVLSGVDQIQTALETNRLFLINQRKEILDLVWLIIHKRRTSPIKRQMEVLSSIVQNVLNPEVDNIEGHQNFTIIEEEDHIIIEEKGYKEYNDISGTIVVDWQL